MLTLILSVMVFVLTLISVKLWKANHDLRSKKQSIAVSYGKIIEQIAPFMDDFPGDFRNFRFIGTPIDGIIFDNDEIKFVEIKTRGSKMSEVQKRIKKLVEKKRVSWHEVVIR